MARQPSPFRRAWPWLLLLAGAPPVLAAPLPVATRTVTIQGLKYLPQTLMVHSGETVTWRNRDMVPHTVTSTTGQFDSGEISPGADWTFRPMKKGKFTYICQYHPGMKGVLMVR